MSKIRRITVAGSVTSGKSLKWNRFTKEEAYNICHRKVQPKPQNFRTCCECYYHDGRCELGLPEEPFCSEFRTDWIYTNDVRYMILNDYDWCLNHFDTFCQVDKELFVALHGVREKGVIYLPEGDDD